MLSNENLFLSTLKSTIVEIKICFQISDSALYSYKSTIVEIKICFQIWFPGIEAIDLQ